MLTRKCQWVHLALLALCTTLTVQSWALGLGELEVESALNERLSGTIELLDTAGLQPAEVVVSMASREDFERVGVERFFYLTAIKFEVETSAGGNAVVKVSSTQPIAEPYINFIVQVMWPNGRLLKEFTVLLDPPTFSQAAAPAVSAPSQPVAQAPQRSAPVARRPATQVDLRPGSNAPRQPPAGGLMTSRDDTLWKIASSTVASQRVSIDQQMLAIQRKNPQAFMRDNINLLKAGYVLDIPTESEALSIDPGAAREEVLAQADDWRNAANPERVADRATQLIDDTSAAPDLRSQIDASPASQAQAAASGQNQGQVRIVANTGELASGSGDDPNVNQLIEEKETLARQVDELTYQIDREKEIATNQVTIKDRQLEVKDAELAQIQQQMKEMREQLAAAQSAAQNQNQSPNPAPAEPSPWWMSPMVLFGIIGVLILILAFVLLTLRKNRLSQDDAFAVDAADDFVAHDDEPLEAITGAVGFDDQDVTEVLSDDESSGNVEPFIGALNSDAASDEFADDEDQVLELSDEPAAAEIQEIGQVETTATEDSGQTGDVIGEAEIYIAYGRYGQAANLLSGVLDNEPERWEVRLKLLEVYVESHDEENFGFHAQYIVDHCDDEDVLLACRELESQLGSGHVDLSTEGESAAQDLGLAQESVVEGESDGESEGFALELEDLELSSDDDAQDEGGADAVEFELEFDTELDSLGSDDEVALSTDAEELSVGASEDLGGDLGMDFDPELDVDEPADAAVETAIELASENEDAIKLPVLDDEQDELAVTSLEVPQEAPQDEPQNENVTAIGDVDDSDDFEFDAEGDTDINATKLDLAEAYVDMGDADGAQDILNEVLEEGTSAQQQKAQEMLQRLAS